MAGERATTIRFSDSMYQRLEAAGEVTGLPINSIVVVACLEWLDAHAPEALAAEFAPMRPMGQFRGPWSRLPSGFRRRLYPFEHFTEKAKGVLGGAQRAAEQRGQSFIGPEHLLISLLEVGDGIGGRALATLGLKASDVVKEIDAWPEQEKPAGPERLLPTSHTKRVIEEAFTRAQAMQAHHVDTGHLAIGLACCADGGVAEMLKTANATTEAVSEAVTHIREVMGPEA